MSFADRAVAACDRAMLTGELSDRHVRDVLKCDGADVRCLYSHLLSDNSMVRMGAAKIIGKLGEVTLLLDAAMQEKDPVVLREMLHVLGQRGEGVVSLEQMVNSEDALVREEAISMLRRSGSADSLLPLLFDRDDALVNRIKRYIHEQKRDSAKDSSLRESC